MTRALDIFKANVDGGESITKRAISELVRNIGSIGGVPALDMDSLDKVDGFDDFRDYLMYLGPHTATGALLGGDIRLTTRCLTLRSDQQDVIALLERSLRDCGVSKVTDISYYLYLVLDSLRNLEGAVPLAVEAEDWKSIVQIAEDIMVEFEGQENIPEEALDCLRDKASDFVYSMRKKAEATGPVPGGYCIAPQYLRTLFPFPITSPNLVSTKLDEQREALAGQTYIAKEESKNPEVFYFLNASKIEDFLSLNCKEYLSEDRSLVAVNLGEDAEPKLTKIAQWLKKERGLRIVNPPRFLSSFIINFCYWLKTERDDDLPVVGLSDKTKKIDSSVSKEISRKITYHGTKLDDYIRRETTARRPHKYDLKDSTGFETYDTGRVGYVTEVLGFAFEDGVKGIEVMYAFRQEFEKTSFVINESNRRRTGLATALEQLAVKETGKQLSKGAVLRRVKDSFENAVADIRDLAMEVTSEEFANIPEDGNSQRVFRGLYYYLKEWKNTSKAGEAIQKSKETLKKIITRLDDVERKCKKLRGQASNATEISYGVQKDIPCLRAIEKLLDDNRGTISPYTCFLPSTFTDKVVELIEPHLAEVEKKLSGFSDELEPYLKRYMAEVDAVTKFDAATYVMIEKDKDDLAKEFKDRFNTHCQSFSKGAAIDLLTLPETSPFCKEIDELVNEAKQLEEIDKLIRDVKKKAESINKLLKSWG